MSYLHVSVSEDQLSAWKDAAKGRDLSLSEWVRMTLDRETVGTPSGGVRVEALKALVQHAGFSVFASDCPGTHMAGVRCDGCGGSKW